MYRNDLYDKKGFVVKTVRLNGIETANVKPSLDELSQFNVGGHDGLQLDVTAMSQES